MRKNISEIKGFEQFNEFEVCDDGRLISHKRGIEHEIRGYDDGHGYLKVDLHYKNKRGVRIHRLVALAFIPNPDNKPQINHKNCNKTDNCVENLEWCNNSENQQHAVKCGLRNYKYDHTKEATKIYQYTKDGYYVAEYNSIGSASISIKGEYNKTVVSNIYNCCYGKFGSAYGYKWSTKKVQRLAEWRTHKCVEMGDSPTGDEDIV